MPSSPKTSKLAPQDFDRSRAVRTLKAARGMGSRANRLEFISRRFLGSPYLVNPLVGDAQSQEVFTVSLDGFDCVTYIETVLAMSRSSSIGQFLRMLLEIRYRDGQIEWKKRNHYMTGWIRANQRKGFVRTITGGPMTSVRRKVLNLLKDLSPHSVTLRYYPKRSIQRVKYLMRDGDLIFFVSTRKGLDIFHVGICFRKGIQVVLRHAARSQGGVVEQPLDSFVKSNSMPGFILARPV